MEDREQTSPILYGNEYISDIFAYLSYLLNVTCAILHKYADSYSKHKK